MKAKTIIHLATGMLIIPFLAASLALTPHQAKAQAKDSSYLEPSEKYSREELAQMLAPIALYPDALLSQVLMASTYPIEVIEADRWVRKNPKLKGESLDDALLGENWDPSVKAMCHFPSILALMSERIAETTNIGNAFLAQEDEVIVMVQELRAKAHAQGNLTSTSERKVIVEKETIIIQPADPRVVYVPYYDPFYIYGPWWYPAYPPYYWGPSRASIGIGISYWPAFYFGFAFSAWSYFDWHQHYIYIDAHRRPRYVRHDRWLAKPGRWNHLPRHRRGVAYRDKSTARKYGQYPSRFREFRPATRGFPERRDQDRERIRRSEDRTRFDRGTSVDVRTRIDDRARQEALRVERDRQIQQRTRIETESQQRQRVERDLPVQQRAEQERRTRERTRIETERQQRQRIKPDIQERARVEQQRQTRQRAELQQQQRSRNNVFNRVEDGRRERQSSERGRSSRQGLSNDSSGRGWSGQDNSGGRSGQDRIRR
jgi:hypothetical protein